MITIAALAAILTSMIAAYRATTRMLSTMAEDHLLSRKFAKTNHSILFVMVIAILISILGKNVLDCFLNLASLGAVIGFGYTSLSAWKLARKNNNRLITVTSAFGTIASITFGIVNLIPKLAIAQTMSMEAFLILSLWCLLGLLFYLYTVTRSGNAGSTSSSLIMFVLLLYSMSMWFNHQIKSTASVQASHILLQQNSLLAFMVVLTGLVIFLTNQIMAHKKKPEKPL